MSEREISTEPDAYEARALRDALAALGLFVAPMLPGEKNHDGRPVEDHFLVYLALLKHQVDATIELNVTDDATRAKWERTLKVTQGVREN
jgi:hypothetical protein